MASEKQIRDLQAAVEARLTHARAIDMTATRAEIAEATAQVEEARAVLAAALVEGAEPCPNCGATPHGLIHDVSVRRTVMPMIEVGCTNCRDYRAQGFTQAQAVERWNDGEYIAPSDGPGIRLESAPEA